MEAKDTVTPTPDHSESIWCPHCGEEFGIESTIEMTKELQAEISFKAGIKEVVDWILSISHDEPDEVDGQRFMLLVMKISTEKWKSKLKKWGITD
jgi:hypothetical protein